jgi:hypothetical protein
VARGRRARLGVDERAEGTASRAKAPRAPREHERAQGRADASRTSHAHAGAELRATSRQWGHAKTERAGRALAELKAARHRHARPSSRPRRGEKAAPSEGATTTPGRDRAGRGGSARAGVACHGHGRTASGRGWGRGQGRARAQGAAPGELAGVRAGGRGTRQGRAVPRPGQADALGAPWPRAMAGEAGPRHGRGRGPRERVAQGGGAPSRGGRAAQGEGEGCVGGVRAGAGLREMPGPRDEAARRGRAAMASEREREGGGVAEPSKKKGGRGKKKERGSTWEVGRRAVTCEPEQEQGSYAR